MNKYLSTKKEDLIESWFIVISCLLTGAFLGFFAGMTVGTELQNLKFKDSCDCAKQEDNKVHSELLDYF